MFDFGGRRFEFIRQWWATIQTIVFQFPFLGAREIQLNIWLEFKISFFLYPLIIDCFMLNGFSFSFHKTNFVCLAHILSFALEKPRLFCHLNVLFCLVLFCGQGRRFGCNARGKNIYRNILVRLCISFIPPSFQGAMYIMVRLASRETWSVNLDVRRYKSRGLE